MQPTRSRRALLAALGTAGVGVLAGCSDRTASSRGVTDVVLHNEAASRRTVDVIVTADGADAPVIDTSVELAPNAQETINNEVVMGSDYEVEVTFTGESIEEYSETQAWDDAGKPLHVIVDEQVVFAVQIG